MGTYTFRTRNGKYSIYCELLQAKYLSNHEIIFNGDAIIGGIWETVTNRIYV